MNKLLLILALVGLIACGSEKGTSTVVEPLPEPVLFVSGEIQVDGVKTGDESNLEVILSLFEPGDTLPRDQFLWPWTGMYQLSFWRENTCSWRLSVTIWDGRESEALPLVEGQPATCAGRVTGPTFWFPER